jgi:hypothetical protein
MSCSAHPETLLPVDVKRLPPILKATLFRLRRAWWFACREPLVHFALGGGLIFLASGLWASPEPDAIVVSPEMARGLADQRSQQLGRPLTAPERAAVVDEYIDEEVLVREAYKQGVDRTDGPIRERLADKMRLLLGREPPMPTREQLESYLKANRARFPEGTFDDLAPTLRVQWVAAQRNEALQWSVAKLRTQYRIQAPTGAKP